MRPMCLVTSHTQTAVLNPSIRLLHGNWMEFSSHLLHLRGRGLTNMCSFRNQPLRAAVIILETIRANWLLHHQLIFSSHILLQMRQTSTNPVRYKVCLCDLTKSMWYWHKPTFERIFSIGRICGDWLLSPFILLVRLGVTLLLAYPKDLFLDLFSIFCLLQILALFSHLGLSQVILTPMTFNPTNIAQHLGQLLQSELCPRPLMLSMPGCHLIACC